MAGTEYSGPSRDFPGWVADEFGNLTFSVTVAGERIILAAVSYDASQAPGCPDHRRPQAGLVSGVQGPVARSAA